MKPLFPRRINPFCGTNTWEEWRGALGICLGWKRVSDRLITEYESAFARAVGAPHAISFGSGRMALYAALSSLGVREQDEVILPAFTCVVVPNAVLYLGARPVYVDIRLEDFNIDTELLEKAITPRTKVILAQHTFGRPCDLEAISKIAKRHGIKVIEDCAHAFGATYRGKPVGGFGDLAIYSTDHSKVINTHLGGVVTAPAPLHQSLREFQKKSPPLSARHQLKIQLSFLIEFIFLHPVMHRISKLPFLVFNKLGFLFYFKDELQTRKPPGYPCPMTRFQAWLGLSQLRAAPKMLEHRSRVASLFAEAGLISPRELSEGSAWLRVSWFTENRARLEKKIGKLFELGIWFTSVVSGRDDHFEQVGYAEGSCPRAEWACSRIINFPTHPRVPEAWLKGFLKSYGPCLRSERISETTFAPPNSILVREPSSDKHESAPS